jgi:hypothetical protein
MDIDYLKILITVILAVIGWIIGHYFTNKQAVGFKRRELVTKYLIDAYEVLTTEITHRELTIDRKRKLENIISQIQLFGSTYQINLAKELADTIANGDVFELN